MGGSVTRAITPDYDVRGQACGLNNFTYPALTFGAPLFYFYFDEVFRPWVFPYYGENTAEEGICQGAKGGRNIEYRTSNVEVRGQKMGPKLPFSADDIHFLSKNDIC